MKPSVQSAEYFKDKVSEEIYKDIVELTKHLYHVYKLTIDSKQRNIDSNARLIEKYKRTDGHKKMKAEELERKRKHTIEKLKVQESLKAFREFVKKGEE